MTMAVGSLAAQPGHSPPSLSRGGRWTQELVERRTLAEVLRRASEIANDSDQLDRKWDPREGAVLLQDAVVCLVDCQSAIEDLQDEALSKDGRIAHLEEKVRRGGQVAAKDARILALEERIRDMSLELAVAKAQADELQLRLRPNAGISATSVIPTCEDGSDIRAVAVGPGSRRRSVSDSDIAVYDERDTSRPFKEPPVRELCVNATGRRARRHRTSHILSQSLIRPATRQRSDGPCPSCGSSLATRAVIAKPCLRGGLDESNTSRGSDIWGGGGRISALGNFFKRDGSCGGRQGLELRFPPYRPVDVDAPAAEALLPVKRQDSRSFLEKQGVIFPVSTLEVIHKGCSTRSTADKMGGGNQEWPDFG